MTFTLMVFLVAFWLVGLLTHTGGAFIHTLLLCVVAMFAVELIRGPHASSQNSLKGEANQSFPRSKRLA